MFHYQLVIQDPKLSAAELESFLGREFSLEGLQVEPLEGEPPQLKATFGHPWLEPGTVLSMLETRFPLTEAEVTRSGQSAVTGHENQSVRAHYGYQKRASPVPLDEPPTRVSKEMLEKVRRHFQGGKPVTRTRLVGFFGSARSAEVDAALQRLLDSGEIRQLRGGGRFSSANSDVEASVLAVSLGRRPTAPVAPAPAGTAGQRSRPPVEERILALLGEGVVASRAGLEAAAHPIQGWRVSRSIERLLEDGLIRRTEADLYVAADQPDPEPDDLALAALAGTNAPEIRAFLAEPRTLDEIAARIGATRTVTRDRLRAMEGAGQIASGRIGHGLHFGLDAEQIKRAQAIHRRDQEDRGKERIRTERVERGRAAAEAVQLAIRGGRMPEEATEQERRIVALLPLEGEVLPSRLLTDLQGSREEVDRDLARLVQWQLLEWVGRGRLRLLRLTEVGRAISQRDEGGLRLPAYQPGDVAQDADHSGAHGAWIPPVLAAFLEAPRTNAEMATLLGVGERGVKPKLAPLLRIGLLHERRIGGTSIWGIRESVLEDYERAQAALRLAEAAEQKAARQAARDATREAGRRKFRPGGLASRILDLMKLAPVLSLARVEAIAEGTSKSGVQAALKSLIEARRIRRLGGGLYIRAKLPDPTPEALALLGLGPQAPARAEPEKVGAVRRRPSPAAEPKPVPPADAGPSSTEGAKRVTPGQAILAHLAAHPRLNTTEAIALAPQATPGAVNQALTGLVSKGQIRRIGRGLYEAADRRDNAPAPAADAPAPAELPVSEPPREATVPARLEPEPPAPDPTPAAPPPGPERPGVGLLRILAGGDLTSKEIEERLGDQAGSGQSLRTQLNDLRKEGLVDREVLSNSGQALRIEWSITPEGRAVLSAHPVAAPASKPPAEVAPSVEAPLAETEPQPAEVSLESAPPVSVPKPKRPREPREPGLPPAERKAAERRMVLEHLTLFRSASPSDLRKRLPSLAKPGGKVTGLLDDLEREGFVHQSGARDPEMGRFSLSETGWEELGLVPPS